MCSLQIQSQIMTSRDLWCLTIQVGSSFKLSCMPSLKQITAHILVCPATHQFSMILTCHRLWLMLNHYHSLMHTSVHYQLSQRSAPPMKKKKNQIQTHLYQNSFKYSSHNLVKSFVFNKEYIILPTKHS